jgi:hypothetical protein
VNAGLVSPSSQGATIGEQQVSVITFQFQSGDEVIQFGLGRINIAVNDGSPACPSEMAQYGDLHTELRIAPSGQATSLDGMQLSWFGADDMQGTCLFGCQPGESPFDLSREGQPGMCIRGNTRVDPTYIAWAP